MQDGFINIGNGSRDGIKSRLTELTGEPGLSTYRLQLTLDLTPTNWSQMLGARAIIAGDLQISFGDEVRKPLSQLQGIYTVAFSPSPDNLFPARLDIGANLFPEQLEALEHQRSGGPLALHLKLHGAVFLDQSAKGPRATGIVRVERSGEPQEDRSVEIISDELVYRIKPADWVEVLERWHYAQGFLLQVPKFSGGESALAINASKHLQKAIKDMAEGRHRDAVAACRDALEAAYGKDDNLQHPELNYKVTELENASKDARFWLTRRGLWAIAHAAKHPDDTTEWTRRDARATVLMLTAMLEQDPPL